MVVETFAHALTVAGTAISVDADRSTFALRCRSGDTVEIEVTRETKFETVQNLDKLDRDRYPRSADFQESDARMLVKVFIRLGRQFIIEGTHQREGGQSRYVARLVHIIQDHEGRFFFELTHWWLTQSSRIADRWLDNLFGDKQSFIVDDIALYRTNLNIIGAPVDDNIQECATLSRLIYGLSSAYLLTGMHRYLSAATAAVQYQRSLFRHLTHDAKHCFWAFGMRRGKFGQNIYEYSLNDDDLNTIPLYEQIYAISGLAQYYRITKDKSVLDDLRRTIKSFNQFYRDPEWLGYFSHLDYATMRPDAAVLGPNKSRKNWNSIGDHIPAYLINVLLALDPLPLTSTNDDREFLDICQKLLYEVTSLIVDKFIDQNEEVLFVNERFHQDWSPDREWRWQRDRGIVGHNYKISWNLCRVANYALAFTNSEPAKQAQWKSLADKCLEAAKKIAGNMFKVGYDQIAGGIFDAMERRPADGYTQSFTWGTTKDFWQQEQVILAYLVLYGCTRDEKYLALSREAAAFWNVFFLDHDNRGIYFRVSEGGVPIIRGPYGNKAGHAIAGYHMFELNYLAHIYQRAYVSRGKGEDSTFCLHFNPTEDSDGQWLNVLPDCLVPNAVEITAVYRNGVRITDYDAACFQVRLTPQDRGCTFRIEFAQKR